MKRKWINRILGQLYDLALWPHPSAWPSSFKVRIWNSLISGMWRPIDVEQKDVSHPFMTMILTNVTMVGWADVLDSDQGDFRRWRAIDISSCVLWPSHVEIVPGESFSYYCPSVWQIPSNSALCHTECHWCQNFIFSLIFTGEKFNILQDWFIGTYPVSPNFLPKSCQFRDSVFFPKGCERQGFTFEW